jgi:hypothetical protein
MKEKFTIQSDGYVVKMDAVVHFVARIKSANGAKMTAILGVNALNAIVYEAF